MHTRRLFALAPLIALLALVGCTARNVADEAPPPTAPTALPSSAPTEALPTTVPTQAPTLAATQAPPTLAPTQAAPAVPTQVPTDTPPQASPTLAATQAAPAIPTQAATGVAAAPVPEQILFTRAGNLVALDVRSGQPELLVNGVREVAATADGRRLALVRGIGETAELWVYERSGGQLWQLTANGRVESTPSWAPDGLSLVYSSARSARPSSPDWPGWSTWCASSEARILDLPLNAQPVAPEAERTLAPGCEPAFGPDGKRIVFATPPTGAAVGNTLRMVNRQGANGWDLARADGTTPAAGALVYSPAWSPDGGQISFQRFLGYQALVDINLVEAGSSYQRQSGPIGTGAGWMLPPHYNRSGDRLLITEHNYSDARGLTGYGVWRTSLLRLGEPSTVAMPEGELAMGAAEGWRLPLATAAAWSPDGASVAVILPTDWQPGAAVDDPRFAASGDGAIWRLGADGQPDTWLGDGVSFGSPLLWVPGLP